jgi:hypothetical protein
MAISIFDARYFTPTRTLVISVGMIKNQESHYVTPNVTGGWVLNLEAWKRFKKCLYIDQCMYSSCPRTIVRGESYSYSVIIHTEPRQRRMYQDQAIWVHVFAANGTYIQPNGGCRLSLQTCTASTYWQGCVLHSYMSIPSLLHDSENHVMNTDRSPPTAC